MMSLLKILNNGLRLQSLKLTPKQASAYTYELTGKVEIIIIENEDL